MIDLTVKTLDSQNHSFSLEDDITVRGFKERIAESVSVPADSQRLIYCGRVLQDEKKLNEYDVNGKVIHLVQRAPPQAGQHGAASGQDQGQGQGRPHAQRPHYRHARAQVHLPRIDGNAMYLGAMSFPADVVEAQGLPVPQLSNTLSNSRLFVARRMINRASQLIDRLEDPTSVPSPSADDSGASAPPQQGQPPPEQEQDPDDGIEGSAAAAAAGGAGGGVGGGAGGGLAQAASAAVLAALSAAGLNNVVTLLGNRGNNEDAGESAGSENANSNVQPEQPAQQQQSEEQPREQGPQQQDTPTSANGQHTRHISPQAPRPLQMARLLGRLLATQDRLRPYIDRYRELMLADPSLPPGSGPEGVEESQRVVDAVSQSLHDLSHAYHALSDIVVDMGQEPPRNLRCRPIIIQHSAVLQAGIPVQVEAHISLHGRISNNNNNGNGGPPADPQPADASESAAPADVNNSDNNQQQVPTATDPQQQHQQQPPFGTVFNLPRNVEVLMEVSPESSMETAPRGEQNQSSSNNNNNNNGAGGMSEGSGGVFSWGSAPPPDFIRNLMQAVTGQIVQGGVTAVPSAPNTAPATGGQQTAAAAAAAPDATNPNPGQSTQARSNTGTHPTTSTQTRSTPRPHVFHSHSHPLGMGMGMGQGRDFDPFLPCNSHHVRRSFPASPSAAGGQQQQQAQANQTPTAENQSQTQPASSTSSSPSSSADNAGAANAARPMPAPNVIPFVNLFSQLLGNAGGAPTVETQEGSNASSTGADRGLGGLMQLFSGGGAIHVVQGLLSEGSGHPAGGMTLADLLEGSPGLGMGQPGSAQDNQPQRGESLLVDLTVTLAQNMTLEGLAGLRVGRWEPLASLRRPLREFFHNSFTQSSSSSSSSSLEVQEEAAERLIAELQPHLHQLMSGLAKSDGVDVKATVENRLRKHILDILRLLLDEAEDDARFGQGMLASVRDLGAELCAILRYSLRGGQAGLESVARRLAVNLTEGVHPALRQWTLNSFVSHVRSYSQRVPQPPESEIRRLLTFRDESSVAETVTHAPASQSQPEPEPMETEVAEERASSEAAETEEAIAEEQGVFPGHEALPSDWVPMIARDGAKQRRQLEMQSVTGSGAAGFSDAYLGGMPSKRRKLIEQQKPRLLASPTPNHSSISISMERLVREGVGRAGVEEVEGAAASVATDPGVRRAFGQAIRDCLHPRRHLTPDFPDPLRFPNATKYFADPERTSK